MRIGIDIGGSHVATGLVGKNGSLVSKESRDINISNIKDEKRVENLLLEIFQLAKNDNMKNLSILTDDSCNYKFYEKHECNQVYKTKIKNFETDKLGNIQEENAYVYERKLT